MASGLYVLWIRIQDFLIEIWTDLSLWVKILSPQKCDPCLQNGTPAPYISGKFIRIIADLSSRDCNSHTLYAWKIY
jgi:hypothetical protein